MEIKGIKYKLRNPKLGDYRSILEYYDFIGNKGFTRKEKMSKLNHLIVYLYGEQFTVYELKDEIESKEEIGEYIEESNRLIEKVLNELQEQMELYQPMNEKDEISEEAKKILEKAGDKSIRGKIREKRRKVLTWYKSLIIEGEKVSYKDTDEMSMQQFLDFVQIVGVEAEKEPAIKDEKLLSDLGVKVVK